MKSNLETVGQELNGLQISSGIWLELGNPFYSLFIWFQLKRVSQASQTKPRWDNAYKH